MDNQNACNAHKFLYPTKIDNITDKLKLGYFIGNITIKLVFDNIYFINIFNIMYNKS